MVIRSKLNGIAGGKNLDEFQHGELLWIVFAPPDLAVVRGHCHLQPLEFARLVFEGEQFYPQAGVSSSGNLPEVFLGTD